MLTFGIVIIMKSLRLILYFACNEIVKYIIDIKRSKF